jgi:hypothetical protein
VEAPTPTLPVVLMVVALISSAFRSPSCDNPDTLSPPKLPSELTLSEAAKPVLPDTLSVPVIPVLVNADTPVTLREPSDAADPEVRDPPTPALPVTEREEPTPTNPSNLDTPLTLNVSEGEEVPIPNLLSVLFQKRRVFSSVNLVPSKKVTPPVLNEELLVPPLVIGSIPVTKLEPEDRVNGPEDNPPEALEKTRPVPSVEITAAEETLSDPPTPTFPVVVSVEELISMASTLPREDSPETLNPLNTPKELDLTVPPTPTLPETSNLPVMPVFNKSVNPFTLSEDRLAKELVVSDPPIPVLPETFNVPVMPVLASEENPPTLREDCKLAPEATLSEPPTPTLPVVFIILALTLPSCESPETLSPPKIPIELTVKEAPIPVLPDTFNVPVIPVVERSENPVTYRLFKLANELTVRELPTPTLPESRELPEIPSVAPEIDLLTCNESSIAADPVVREPPIPVFPVTDRDDPTPRNPEIYPLPLTSNVYLGDEVPTPSLLFGVSQKNWV